MICQFEKRKIKKMELVQEFGKQFYIFLTFFPFCRKFLEIIYFRSCGICKLRIKEKGNLKKFELTFQFSR